MLAFSNISKRVPSVIYKSRVLQHGTTQQKLLEGVCRTIQDQTPSNAFVVTSILSEQVLFFLCVMICMIWRFLLLSIGESQLAHLTHERSSSGMHNWRWGLPWRKCGLGSKFRAESSWPTGVSLQYFPSFVLIISVWRHGLEA